MENKGAVDVRYRETDDAFPALKGKINEKNTFLEKHLRICHPMPSEAQMKAVVKQIYDYRQKGKKSKVASATGAKFKTKQEVFGGLTPEANTTLFINLAGFQETNAWIEKHISSTNKHAQVPILGNGTVVTYDSKTNTYSVKKAGKLILSIAVGKDASFLPKEDSSVKGPLSMNSKVVYHFGGVV
jgi:hypothetical protein